MTLSGPIMELGSGRANKRDSIHNCSEQVPLARHTFQHMRAARLESEPRASHEIPHRLRDQNFARSGKMGHTRTDMHRDSCKIGSNDLAFPSVQAAAHLKAERVHRIADRAGTADRR